MPELLVSTRDVAQAGQSYERGLLQGLAADGGLLTLPEYPPITSSNLEVLGRMSYVDLYTWVKSQFTGDSFTTDEIRAMAEQAYSLENFPSAEDGNVAPVSHLYGDHYLLELFDGPARAFKDLALGPVALEMAMVLRRRGEHLLALGATSGDTGSAAEHAMKGISTLGLIMLSPLGGTMTSFQRAQMGIRSGGNIRNVSLDADFGPIQKLVKEIKADPQFSDLGAVNSINWGRIASQVPYYVSAYLQTIKQAGLSIGDPIDVVVPSGNFGNMQAAYIARSMGVPIRRLIVATNENDVLHRLIQTGEYRTGPTVPTSSPSMDINEASNLERLFFDLMGKDPEKVAAFMGRFATHGTVSLDEFGVRHSALREERFDSGISTDWQRKQTIRMLYRTTGKIIDPHTADAFNVALRNDNGDGVPIVSVGTAHHVKFEETMGAALGFVPNRAKRDVGLEDKARGGFTELPPNATAIKDYIRQERPTIFS